MLGTIKDIPAIIKSYDIGIIVSTAPATAQEINEYVFDLCQKHNIRLIFLNDLMLMVDRQVTQPLGSFEYPVWLDERLEFKAMHDAITGLPNRYLFQDRIKRSIAYAKRYKSRLAVLFIKIERKNINTDQLGRKYGDNILIEVARRLATCQRGSDTLAYVGKNKFAVILENVTNDDIPETVSRRIFTLLSEPIKIEQLEVKLNIKINIFLDSDGVDDLYARCKNEVDFQSIPEQKIEALSRNDSKLGK
jgi:diguanylate cyclase (GGDEF)-like protein